MAAQWSFCFLQQNRLHQFPSGQTDDRKPGRANKPFISLAGSLCDPARGRSVPDTSLNACETSLNTTASAYIPGWLSDRKHPAAGCRPRSGRGDPGMFAKGNYCVPEGLFTGNGLNPTRSSISRHMAATAFCSVRSSSVTRGYRPVAAWFKVGIHL